MTARFSLLCLLAALSLCCCGCGTQSPPAAAGESVAPATLRSTSLAELLQELDSLPAPAGMDSARFGALKQSLRGMLQASGRTRFASRAPGGETNTVDDLTLDFVDSGAGGLAPAVSWSYRNTGDYNQDSEVGISDLTALGQALGQTPSHPQWASQGRFADGDLNGEVNASDITPIGKNLLSSVTDYLVEGTDSLAGPWTELGTVLFTSGTVVSGGKTFVFPTTGHGFDYYRVTARDAAAALSPASHPAAGFSVGSRTTFLGAPGGPQLVSLADDVLTLTLPGSEPTTFAPGDTLVGTQGGSLFAVSVLQIQQSGTALTLQTEPAGLPALLDKGVLHIGEDSSQAGSQSLGLKRAALAPFSTDETDLTVHDGDGIKAVATNLAVGLVPLPEYNLYRRITGESGVFGALGLLNVNVSLDAYYERLSGSGDFNPQRNDPAYETLVADTTLPIPTLINSTRGALVADIPVELKVWIGVCGTGGFHGQLTFDGLAHYNTALLSARFDKQGESPQWVFTAQASPADGYSDPTPGNQLTLHNSNTQSGSVEFYVRIELAADLLDNPAQRVSCALAPSFEVVLAPTATPEQGLTYTRQGYLRSNVAADFAPLGIAAGSASSTLQGPVAIDAGFLSTVPGVIFGDVVWDIYGNGAYSDEMGDATLKLYDITDIQNPVLLDTQVTTDADASYSFSGVPDPTWVRLEVSRPEFTFSPASFDFVFQGVDNEHTFFGTGPLVRISGTVTEDGTGMPVQSMTIDIRDTEIPGLEFFPNTGGTGSYDTGLFIPKFRSVNIEPNDGGAPGWWLTSAEGKEVLNEYMLADKVLNWSAKWDSFDPWP